MKNYKTKQDVINAIKNDDALRSEYTEVYSRSEKKLISNLEKRIDNYEELLEYLKVQGTYLVSKNSHYVNFDNSYSSEVPRYLFSVGENKEVMTLFDIMGATNQQVIELFKVYNPLFRLAYSHLVMKKEYSLAEELINLYAKNVEGDYIRIDTNAPNEYIPYINYLDKKGDIDYLAIGDYIELVNAVDDDDEDSYSSFNGKKKDELPINVVDKEKYQEIVTKYSHLIKEAKIIPTLVTKNEKVNDFDMLELDPVFRETIIENDSYLYNSDKILKALKAKDEKRLKRIILDYIEDKYSSGRNKTRFFSTFNYIEKLLGQGFIDIYSLEERLRAHILLEKLK
jgi:hypothetical protein